MNDRAFDMPAEEFRRHAHVLVDWIADSLERPDARRVVPDVDPGDVVAALGGVGDSATTFDALRSEFDRVVAPALAHWNHPRFFAYFPNTGSYPAVLAEMIATALNVNGMSWQTCPGAVELEQVATDHLRRMLGLPEPIFAELTDTASTSTLYALAAARTLADPGAQELGLARANAGPLCVYASEEAHSSVAKAAATLGIGTEHVRQIATDDQFRMRVDELDRAIAGDRARGARPFAVVATVGTTSTAAIDPVRAVSDVCGREKLWLHVDAAYGGPAAIVPELRWVLDGCERADSLVLNPHKWLFVPMDCSVLYCRRPDMLARAFTLTPAILTGSRAASADPMNYGLALGRRFRALKLWFVLRYFGADGLAALIRRHVELARAFAERIDRSPLFDRVAPVHLSTVVFRLRAGDDANEALLRELNATGEVFLSHTVARGAFCLRLAIGNIRTTVADVDRVWELLEALACSR